ncbi:MAG: tRNA (adenosine(37)-N6)-threonylcarbamoyltransferase complex ATPase subunit type 1 TsaE [Rikenellaceae bacterium]|nr:tRNA (adenosine(37)-N6)-threonylcarbamoyltransferase complex ATPase subunit type 1 TsaE [Rikenellaceae bacterium]
MEDRYIVSDLDDLEEVAGKLASALTSGDDGATARIVLFYGSMGAGKTTLIKAVCEALGVEDTVTSPTFALVNEYRTAEDKPVYHFDFYRIERIEEAYDLGYEEYFYSGGLCLVEWPEKIEPLIPYDDPSVRLSTVSITVNEKGARIIDCHIV